MKIADINPYIRYLNMGKQRAINAEVRAYDARLFYILNGKCNFRVEADSYVVDQGTLILLRSGIKYRFENSKSIEMIVFNFDFTRAHTDKKEVMRPALAADYKAENSIDCGNFSDCEVFNRPIVRMEMYMCFEKLLDIVNTYRTPKLFHDELASAKFKLFLCNLANSLAYESSNAPLIVDSVLEYIKGNYGKRISNSDVARHAGYHSYYLNRIILSETGKTIHRHISECRLKRAKELLIESELSVFDVAEACGFSSAAHFSSFFKVSTGKSPSEYRKKYRNRI